MAKIGRQPEKIWLHDCLRHALVPPRVDGVSRENGRAIVNPRIVRLLLIS